MTLVYQKTIIKLSQLIINMSKIVIVGSTGYIAQAVINKCNALKIDYVTVSRNPSSSDYFLDLDNSDFTDIEYISKDDTVIFLAAISSPDTCDLNFSNSFNINVINTISFIKATLQKGAKVIFFSSDVVYGNIDAINDEISEDIFITGSYALMKLSVEKYFSTDTNFKIFRLSYVFSWNDKFMNYLHSNYNSNSIAEIFHPFYRKMIYLNDLVDALFSLIQNWIKYSDRSFNLCGDKFYSRIDLAEFYNKFIGQLKYQVVKPDINFYKARKEKINITSLNLSKLICRNATTIENAFLIEKNKYE